MERKELQKTIADLEDTEFMLQMKDHWNAWDFARDRELNEKIKELKEELKNMEV